jgi:hypothetical protein
MLRRRRKRGTRHDRGGNTYSPDSRGHAGPRGYGGPRSSRPRARPRRRRRSRGRSMRSACGPRLGPGRCRRGGLTVLDRRRRGRRRRTGRRHGRSGRRSGRLRRRGRSRPRRQQSEGVDIALRIVGPADAEVHVGDVVLEVARRPDAPDALALRDALALGDVERSEMGEGHGVAVVGPDRRGPSVARQPACKRHPPGRRRSDEGAGRRADVDSGVAALVVLGSSELETSENGPVGRPAPGRRACGGQERKQKCTRRRCHFRQHLTRR